VVQKILFVDPWSEMDDTTERFLRNIPDSFDIIYTHASNKKLIEKELAEADYLITGWGAGSIDRTFLAKAKKLRLIQMIGAGFENVNIKDTESLGIIVANTPGVNAEAVAEHVIMFLLIFYRRFLEAHSGLKRGDWLFSKLRKNGIEELCGKQIGLLGLGRVGKELAKKINAFKVNLTYYDIMRDKVFEDNLNIKYVNFDELFRQADAVSLHIPLTPDTRGLVGARELSLMKSSAIIINTARGPIINHDALVEALSEGVIAGACLDCFDPEPVEENDPLLKLENVVLTPHLAGSTVPVRGRALEIAFDNIQRVSRNESPRHIVNKMQS